MDEKFNHHLLFSPKWNRDDFFGLKFHICTYNISGKHPENIIEEKSSQKDETGHDIVQMEKLDTVNSKCQTKQVICDPVFFPEIPDPNKGTENQCDQIMSCEFVFENFFVFNNTGTSKIGIEK